MQVPDVILVGPPKTGTTTLYHYLKSHPKLFLPNQKELHYFSHSQLLKHREGPGDERALHFICTSWEQYLEHFNNARPEQLNIEISPSYFYYGQVAKHIHDRLNAPKIIISLRNPVDKAYSQYNFLVRDGREQLCFEDALQQEPTRINNQWGDIWHYKQGSVYAPSLRNYLEIFGQEKVMVIQFEELIEDPQKTMAQVFRFIEVPPVTVQPAHFNRSGPPRVSWLARLLGPPSKTKERLKNWLPTDLAQKIKNSLQQLNTGSKQPMQVDTRRRLEDAFRQDVREVEEILGRPCNWF
ncbi:MAG: sulfotransferase family protein [Bacteroidota bacterium]